jgi:uncharacterized repeat protein (TIGR03803 family)
MTKLQTFEPFLFALTRVRERCIVAQLGLQTICVIFTFCIAAGVAPAQTFTSLVNFGQLARNPPTGLVQGTDGNFYGITSSPIYYGDNSNPDGSIFKITSSGALTGVHRFDGSNGRNPQGALILAYDGSLYGTTPLGGTIFNGTIYKVTAEGEFSSLYSFGSSTAGAGPIAGLVQGTNGNFYGTTFQVGGGGGSVFEFTPGGVLTFLYDFNLGWYSIPTTPLVQATDGNFYGTTSGILGVTNTGTIFKITPAGELTTLYTFNSNDGGSSGLIQGTDGNFYGTTSSGGTNGDGTVFMITPGGKFTTLHNFSGADGAGPPNGPSGGLIQATDGNFYGATSSGGTTSSVCSSGCGTLFSITPAGTLTTLHSFDHAYGAGPNFLVQGTDGNFYGTTNGGGTTGPGCTEGGCGTVFSLSVGLSPFVRLMRGTAEVGQTVGILGQGFTGATGVSFNGTAATFTIKKDTYLIATVPAGTTTGSVTVAAPGGTLTSNAAFRVTPQITSFTPNTGSAATQVTVTGVSLTQTTEVSFCGVPASFTVNSDTQLTATVPAGAATGEIVVTTAGGRVWSATDFTVTP